jgi:hypothetical protein
MWPESINVVIPRQKEVLKHQLLEQKISVLDKLECDETAAPIVKHFHISVSSVRAIEVKQS